MRTILMAAALLSACVPQPPRETSGRGGHRQPAEPTPHAEPSNAQQSTTILRAITASYVDAGVSDIDTRKAALDEALARHEADEAAKAVSTADFAAGPAPVAIDSTDEEPAETFENGVRVVFVGEKSWCAPNRFCGPSRAACRRFSPACKMTSNVACFFAASRTDGVERAVCMAAYSDCEGMRIDAEGSREYEVGDDCVVMRYRAPRKR
jgi:hypothetical protein